MKNLEEPAIGAVPSEPSARRRADPNRVLRAAASPGLFGVYVLLALVALFWALLPGTFPTFTNLRSMTGNQAVPAMVALALILPLTAGEFDISGASVLTLAAIVATGLLRLEGFPVWLACLLGVGSGALVGLCNGLLVAVVGINSIVVTLASGSIALGIAQWWTNGRIFYENIPEGFKLLGQTDLLGLPLPVFYSAALAVVLWWLLGYTPAGRYLRALGDNKLAAELAGLRTKRLTVGAFLGAGLIAGIAGVVEASKLGAGNPTVGPSFMLPAFAAVFLGATMIEVGHYNVLGTLLGVAIVAVGLSGLQLLGVPFYVESIFTGIVLLLAVALTKVNWRRLRRHGGVRDAQKGDPGAQT